MFDYLSKFPIPESLLPTRLRNLLLPVDMTKGLPVEVLCRTEVDLHGEERECLNLQMAVVPGDDDGPIEGLREAGEGVVEFSIPCDDGFGCLSNYSPSISGYDYVIAAWGNSSFSTFNLAEKVWMALGLTPRCEGDDKQRLIYDDLSEPVLNVAEGEISSSYRWKLQKNVVWTFRNEYLRHYLWMRGARGVRVFFYETFLEDSPELYRLLDGKKQVVLKPESGTRWYELDIRLHMGKILLQLWASVEAVTPKQMETEKADGIIWPGMTTPMDRRLANDILQHHNPVYLDDKFLKKYEDSPYFDIAHYKMGGFWHSDPSYKGQWSFTECRRIGRNLIEVPMRELYKAKPASEILHAFDYALEPSLISSFSLDEEHIVSKVQRFVDAELELGDVLSNFGRRVGFDKMSNEWVHFDKGKISAEGWGYYAILGRLAHVVPLDLSKSAFLARCKTIQEIVTSIPAGYLRSILIFAGCDKDEIKDFRSLKLLQILLNIVFRLNSECETMDAFEKAFTPGDLTESCEIMAPLFLNNDLRIADAHESLSKFISAMQRMGLDTKSTEAGYGPAFDFIFDKVIKSLNEVTEQIKILNAQK